MKRQPSITTMLAFEKEPFLQTDSSFHRSQCPSPEQPPPRFIKKRIGPYSYRLDEMIGTGFSSTVFRGYRDNDKNQPVALKVVQLSNIKQHRRNLLQNQVKILKQADHPHILKFMDLYYTQNNYYIVTEYCQGGSLQSRIDSHAHFNWPLAVYEVGLACQYLADRQIIHRDIKPANVLIKNGRFKLSDFGFTYRFESHQVLQQNYLIGSPLYMPIESLADNLYSTKSDSFALGVLIYYLASRRFPWRGKDKTELISNYRRRAHRSSAVAHLPPRVKHMVSGLLEMQPEKRLHLCECDLEVFLHMGLPLQLEEQLEALRGRYSEQLKLCQFIDSLFHNYDAYSWANDYLQEFMARHLGSITVRFQWERHDGLSNVKEDYCIPQNDPKFGSDDYYWLNNCLKDTIRMLTGQMDQGAHVMLQKLLQYQQVVEAIMFQPRKCILERIDRLVLHKSFELLRPDEEYIAKTYSKIDFYSL